MDDIQDLFKCKPTDITLIYRLYYCIVEEITFMCYNIYTYTFTEKTKNHDLKRCLFRKEE